MHMANASSKYGAKKQMSSLLAYQRGSAFGGPVGRGKGTNTGFAYKAARVKCKCILAKPNQTKEKLQPDGGQYLRLGALFPIDAFFARPVSARTYRVNATHTPQNLWAGQNYFART